ncbi:MAG: hypothetical protein AB7N76_25485 [Planctomycetota bacterium]
MHPPPGAPPPYGPPPGAPILFAPTPPAHGLGAAVGGLFAGATTALGSCCCGLTVGWFGGVIAALTARQRADRYGFQEGLLTGAMTTVVAIIVFTAISVPSAFIQAKNVREHGLPPELEAALPPNLSGLLKEGIAQSDSPLSLVMNTGFHSLILALVCMGGAAGVGFLMPKQGFPPPPQGGFAPPPYPPPGPGYYQPYYAPGYAPPGYGPQPVGTTVQQPPPEAPIKAEPPPVAAPPPVPAPPPLAASPPADAPPPVAEPPAAEPLAAEPPAEEPKADPPEQP